MLYTPSVYMPTPGSEPSAVLGRPTPRMDILLEEIINEGEYCTKSWLPSIFICAMLSSLNALTA